MCEIDKPKDIEVFTDEEIKNYTQRFVNKQKEEFSVFIKKDSGPLLLLIHGATYTYHTWIAMISNLKSYKEIENCSILAPNLRSHGDSKSNSNDLKLDKLSE